jgi:hypothetical protein
MNTFAEASAQGQEREKEQANGHLNAAMSSGAAAALNSTSAAASSQKRRGRSPTVGQQCM